MKIRYLFLWAIIAAILGMVTACDDLNSDSTTVGKGTVVTGATLAEKFEWIDSNAASNTSYVFEVNSDEFLNPQTLSYSGKSKISIQLTGIGGVKTIEIYGYGSLFTIGNNVTLSLNENIVLKGSVNVVAGGNLIMNNGSKITNGSGVSVLDNGTFTMNGGEISGNTGSSFHHSNGVTATITSHGGGVYISNGTFTMNGGEISGNTAGSSDYISSSSYGGGVYMEGGTFTMNGGKISGNTTSSSSDWSNGYGFGGGVYVGNGTFTMTGGEISGNTVSTASAFSPHGGGGGGGVFVNRDSSFEKTGGIITGYSSDTVNGNVAYGDVQNNRGHAVYVAHNDSRFIRRKETTAGQGDNLKYIFNEPAPPTISGAWDE
jgi:hypothetical protein